MGYYITCVTLIILCGALLQNKEYKIAAKNKVYAVFVGMLWMILSGLRDISIGADTINYVENFEIVVPKWSWTELFEMFKRSFSGNIYEERDVGYYLFVKAVQIFTQNSRIYLILIAGFVMIPVIWWIMKYSCNKCMSYVTYTAIFFPFMGLTGIRQALAIVLVSICGYSFVKERKFLKFLVLVFLAVCLHKTAIIILPFYFLGGIRLKKWHRYVAVIGIMVCFAFQNSIIAILNKIGGYNYQMYEGAGTYTFTIFVLGILALTFYQYDYLVKNNKEVGYYINAIVIGSFLLPLSYINPTMLRLAYYYYIYLVLLIPELPYTVKEKRLMRIGIYGAMILMLLRSGADYKFFFM